MEQTNWIDFKGLIKYLRNTFALEWMGIHGLPHWARVYINAKRVAESEQLRDPQIPISYDVLKLFAFMHDHQRVNDGRDLNHGGRAIRYARLLQGTLYQISVPELRMLEEAMDLHSNGHVYHENPTVMICWDADRLDLGRVGKTPNPEFLCTPSAKEPSLLEKAYLRSIGRG